MEKHILSNVIMVEKEIRERLEVEKKRSQEWLKKENQKVEQEVTAAERQLQEALRSAMKNAERNAEKKASEIINRAHTRARMLKEAKDEKLRKIIIKHITKIIPV
jgi:vacuolar-type H+-ATPase subunit H